MLRLAAEIADVWSAFGGMAVGNEDEYLSALEQQSVSVNRRLDEIGRDPKSLQRSLLAFRPLTPWRDRESFQHLTHHAYRLGFDEIILYKPSSADERRIFDAVVTDLLPELRSR